MGNNRSLLASGSTATTASLNSTSSLPCNPNLQPQIQRISNTPFLKRFRHPHQSSHNLDETDHHHADHKKKNHKTFNINKKAKKQTNDPDDFKNVKKLENNKLISLSASNIVSKNLKIKSTVNTNVTDYSGIDESLPGKKLFTEPENLTENLLNDNDTAVKTDIVESLYESTLEMDLADKDSKQSTKIEIATCTKNTDFNKENIEINEKKMKISNSNANLYSEVFNKNKSSSHSNQSQQSPPVALQSNKKNHLQPITNFFNKLTKTTNKSHDIQDKHDIITAPGVPAKAFNPSIEFYSNLILTSTAQTNEELEDDFEEDGIYSKIEKLTNLNNENQKLTTKLPPIPTTHVPLLNEEDIIETCLQNYNEYQTIQEYEYIKTDINRSPCEPNKPLVYTTIEPLNINNQVYYSFTSDSQEQFDLRRELKNEYISRVDVRSFENERTYAEINLNPKKQSSTGANLIS